MIRQQRAASRILAVALLAAVATAFAPSEKATREDATNAARVVTIGSIASQLGVKVVSKVDDEFGLGVQFTGNLVEPAKLEGFGIKGMHAGARVVAARIAADRVYVEADELEPPSRASVRLTLDKDGNLVRPPRA